MIPRSMRPEDDYVLNVIVPVLALALDPDRGLEIACVQDRHLDVDVFGGLLMVQSAMNMTPIKYTNLNPLLTMFRIAMYPLEW